MRASDHHLCSLKTPDVMTNKDPYDFFKMQCRYISRRIIGDESCPAMLPQNLEVIDGETLFRVEQQSSVWRFPIRDNNEKRFLEELIKIYKDIKETLSKFTESLKMMINLTSVNSAFYDKNARKNKLMHKMDDLLSFSKENGASLALCALERQMHSCIITIQNLYREIISKCQHIKDLIDPEVNLLTVDSNSGGVRVMDHIESLPSDLKIELNQLKEDQLKKDELDRRKEEADNSFIAVLSISIASSRIFKQMLSVKNKYPFRKSPAEFIFLAPIAFSLLRIGYKKLSQFTAGFPKLPWTPIFGYMTAGADRKEPETNNDENCYDDIAAILIGNVAQNNDVQASGAGLIRR